MRAALELFLMALILLSEQRTDHKCKEEAQDDQKNSKDTRSVDANNYDIINGETSIINKETSLKVAAGYEYHFAATGHLDFYVGAEAGYLGRFYSATKETATNTTNAKTMSGNLWLTRTSEYDNYKYSHSPKSKKT